MKIEGELRVSSECPQSYDVERPTTRTLSRVHPLKLTESGRATGLLKYILNVKGKFCHASRFPRNRRYRKHFNVLNREALLFYILGNRIKDLYSIAG